MTTFYGVLIAAALLGQAQVDQPVTGEVVDEQGKPVAGAEVVLYSPPTVYGKGTSVEVRATSDAQGKFTLIVPRFERIYTNGVHFFAYRTGLAITAHRYARPPYRLVLAKPGPRTVTVEGPDGRPIAGARVALRLLHVFGGSSAEIPASLADPLAVRTGPDGMATISTMAPRDQLVAVRVTADAIGTQDISLIKRLGRVSEESVITIKLKPTSHFAGRIVDQDGHPVAGQLVEVWSRGDAFAAGPNTVELNGGPLCSAADGSFQTPDNLMAGSAYRVTVRAPGQEPVLSDWITIGEKPRSLPLMVQRPFRTIRGRVLDRQGQPVANVEVFQSGDGPEPATTQTDGEGRFSLGGFRHGPVFVFVRGVGFRFHGQLAKPTERNVTVELTRTSERPARGMKMLPDPIPLDESRALARRLVEPLWEKAAQEGTDGAKYRALTSLASIDPARALGMLESVKFQFEGWKNRLQRELVPLLARTDFEEATAVAESIADPAWRASALIELADALPIKERERKLALLDGAVLHARIAADQGDRLFQMGEVAERWYELGQVDKARALFAEGLEIAGHVTDKTDFKRGKFAGRLARVNLPAALAIAKDFDGERDQGRILGGIAFRLIDQNPADAERVWYQTKGMGRLVPMDPTLCWKMAALDPARARRGIESVGATQFRPELYLFLALGSKARDESASRQAFQTALEGIDRQLRERPEQYQTDAGKLLPFVERIDPGLVPELFWRDVSSRLPVGNPRTLSNDSPAVLIRHLAWYDREVAAALFEPSRARLSPPGDDMAAPADDELGNRILFWSWSMFDPRAAVARLETLPIDPKLPNNAIDARLAVAKSLAQDHEQRWHEIWDRHWNIILGGTRRDF
jgi:hypothetical protein